MIADYLTRAGRQIDVATVEKLLNKVPRGSTASRQRLLASKGNIRLYGGNLLFAKSFLSPVAPPRDGVLHVVAIIHSLRD
jgi:hypothetical protein